MSKPRVNSRRPVINPVERSLSHRYKKRSGWIGARLLVFLLFLVLCGVSSVQAQRIEAEAIQGTPFGVGKIAFDLPEAMLPEPLGVEGLVLSESNGRVFYPALETLGMGKVMKEVLEADTPLTTGGPVRQQVGGILRNLAERPPKTTMYFLFRGEGPLSLTLHARTPISFTVAPRNAPRQIERLLGLWWKSFVKEPKLFEQKPDYPPQVENYLMCMLATRLNRRLPESKQTPSVPAELEKELGLTTGTEAYRVALQQDRILGMHHWNEPADRPLPTPIDFPPLTFPDVSKDVEIEPLAFRVPAECFYVRFGSFANFLWLQDTLAKWGGDAQNLVALRGLDIEMSGRIERQLILKQNLLSRLMGDTAITDVAIVGTDMFFREGAAYGILFQARNAMMLGPSLIAQRTERLKAGGATEEKVKINGQDVSFISSRDGSVRSYFVPSGDYFFVTTSKKLAELFLRTGEKKSETSLGASEEFRHARSIMPLSRNDTVFVYVSDAFFRHFTSPAYRIEMARRLQSVSDVELVQLAKLAAASEGKQGDSIESLIRGNFLPPSFGPLSDGSRVVLDRGDVHDQLRGWRGAYLPIPDMPVDRVSAFEAEEYRRFAENYRSMWGRMDPMMVGMSRKSLGNGRDQVVVDVKMTPFAPQHFEKLKKHVGLPDQQRFARIPGDLAVFEAVLNNQRLFGGLRDFGPAANLQFGSVLPQGRMRDWLVGYLGCLGDLGWLKLLNLGFPPPDVNGFSNAPLTGGWRLQFGDYTIFSFHSEVLAEVAPQLRFEQAERPAQLRIRIDDPTRARIMPLANAWAYHRTRETSLNNLRLMQALDQQLHVPPASCREAAEFLLDAKLKCPLGGEYVFQPTGSDHPETAKSAAFGRWTSTAFEKQSIEGRGLRTPVPPGYVSPPWSWFRGLDLDAVMNEKNFSAHAEVIMQMPEKVPEKK